MNTLTVALKRQGIRAENFNVHVREMTDKLSPSLTKETNEMRFLKGKYKENCRRVTELLKNFQLLNITGENTGTKKESKEESSGSNQQRL